MSFRHGAYRFHNQMIWMFNSLYYLEPFFLFSVSFNKMEKLGPTLIKKSFGMRHPRIVPIFFSCLILAQTKVCQISIEINHDFQCGKLPTEF